MTAAIIIFICILLLLAYVFDVSSPLTKIPSVILLLILGWSVRQFTLGLNVHIPDLNPLLPFLGTIGLILIVLEGALELELNQSKINVIKKSTFLALLPMLLFAFGLAYFIYFWTNVSFKLALINAIPFSVISSAIAIPSVRNLREIDREFIIYESSLSDIFGVLFFNFIALNEVINGGTFGTFFIQLLIIIVISFVAVLGLSFLLSRIKHHITFAPIILMVILIYAVSKYYHLPGLIFILVFGLFLGNLDELKNFKWIDKLRPEKLNKEIIKFKEITTEATFLVRALFFIIFGFLIEIKDIMNIDTFLWAGGIVIFILALRWLFVSITKLPKSPLLFIAPRGLITILLFLSIIPDQSITLINKSLVIQTIVLSVIVMMFGLFNKSKA
ncbi:MAG TPA: cation:proton antiporter [Saprospiraceae bacterium]|nr:cation:proton antiporter [Saprospiraceae bacterium]